MRFIIVILLLLFGTKIIYAQKDEISSLRKALQNETRDSARVEIMSNLARAYIYTKIDSAAYYGQKVLALSQKKGIVRGEISGYQILSRVMVSVENYSEELKLSTLYLKKSEELQDTGILFFARRNIMWSYEHIEDYNKSLEYALSLVALSDAAALKKQPVFIKYHEMAYRLLGDVYKKLGKKDSVLKYYAIAHAYALQSENPELLALNTGTMGGYYLEQNNIDSAFYYFQTSTYYAKASSRSDIIDENLVGIAHVFLRKGNADSSLNYARQAMDKFSSIPDTSNMKIVAKLLSEIFARKNNVDSAYKYLKYASTLNELQAQQEKIKKARDLLFSQSFEEQQLLNEKALAKAQYENNKKIFLLVSVLVILAVIAYMFYRNSKQKQKDAIKIQEAYDQLKFTQAQLIQSEKMASLGELTAGIAHEIQNPLNFVNNFSEVNKEMLEELKAERLKPNAERDDSLQDELINDVIENEQKINHHGKRADAIVKGMLQHSRKSEGKKEATNINALCDEYLRLSYHGLRAKNKSFNADIKTNFDETIEKINIIPQDIGRVLLNLINNAFYAVSERQKQEDETYKPMVGVSTKKSGNRVLITVSDNGSGIPEAIKEKIFQPFFTTKPTGQGTGLGLSLSYDIIKVHGGEIKVESEEGKGTVFMIMLPVV